MLQNEQDLKNDNGDENTEFQRAYVNGKLGGVAVQAGRYNLNLAQGNVYDNRFDGIQASYGKDIKLTAGYGKADPGTKTTVSDSVYYADLTGKVGSLDLGLGYYSFDGDKTGGTTFLEKNNIFKVGADYAFTKDLKLGAMYLKGDADHRKGWHAGSSDDDGFVVALACKGAKAAQPGTWGVTAKYYDQGAMTYADHTMNGLADDMYGFKGYGLFANYTFAKNIVGQVEYYDLKDKVDDTKAKTLWSQVIFTF